MKKNLVFLFCGLILGAVAAWALISFVVPRWHHSAVDNTFWQVTSQLDQGGEAFAYFHTEKVMEAVQSVVAGLQKNVSALPAERQAQAKKGLDMVSLMVKGYGLDEISGLGYSSFAVKPGLHRVRIVLHHRPGRDHGLIWKIAGPGPRDLDEIDLLPADTALAFDSDYDIVQLFAWVGQMGQKMAGPGMNAQSTEQSMAMMKAGLQMAGFDYDRLVKSYGKRMGFLLTLDPEKRVMLPLGKTPLSVPEPAFALLVRVNDDYLFETLKGKLTATGHNKASEENGLKKIVFPRFPFPIPMEPVIAQKGEWLVLASQGAVADSVLGKGPRLAASADYKTMAYRLPRRGNGFGFASPRLPRLVAQLLRENKATFPVPAAMEKIAAFLEQSKGFCQVWENSDQGLVYTINHGFEISSLPGLIDAFAEIARAKVPPPPALPEPPLGAKPRK